MLRLRPSRGRGSAGGPARTPLDSPDGRPAQPWARKPIRRRGATASMAWWLCGPRPCRLTPTSGGGPAQGRASRSGVGSSSSTAPVRETRGASEPAVASTIRWPGNARRSALSAGTATSTSPTCSARSTSAVGRAVFPGLRSIWRAYPRAQRLFAQVMGGGSRFVVLAAMRSATISWSPPRSPHCAPGSRVPSSRCSAAADTNIEASACSSGPRRGRDQQRHTPEHHRCRGLSTAELCRPGRRADR
jgi:hypothetical protein